MLTDADIKKLVTVFKKILPTKEDLKKELSNYATKDDLKKELSRYATKEDLNRFATKDDLDKLTDNIANEVVSIVSP